MSSLFRFIKSLFKKDPLIYILEKDSKGRGYTVHFEQFPDTFAQGMAYLLSCLITFLSKSNSFFISLYHF